MNKEIEILTNKGIKTITQEKLFIIAEVGNQFAGKFDTAIELCKVAKDCDADAVKFIFWFPEEIMADKNQVYSYETTEGTKTEPMFDLLNRLRLTLPEWAEIKRYCDSIDIIFMATILSPSGIDWASEDGLALPIIKLSTWDWNFKDLWCWAAKTGLPTITDIGAVTNDEFTRNVNWFIENRNFNFIPMHCFHTNEVIQRNMATITALKDNYLVGYSATDFDDNLDIMAIGLGASLLEKRLTLNRKGGILHDAISKEPTEFKQYVTKMREMKSSLGKLGIYPSERDLVERKKWFRRIVADCDIEKGETILRTMLEAKRGESGISPEYIWDYVGKAAKHGIYRNQDIKPTDI